MKILKSGKNCKPKLLKGSCSCGCVFEFNPKIEGVFNSDQREGDWYEIKCPECKRVVFVDTKS